MSAFGRFIWGRGRGARCDGCGRFTTDPDGSYRKPDGSVGYITGQGRDSALDFCDECEGTPKQQTMTEDERERRL